jgi:predicted Zn-dependent protease
MGDLERAEADFRQALTLDPDLELANANLASILMNTGREEEAKPIVSELQRRHPGNPDYRRAWEMLNAGR